MKRITLSLLAAVAMVGCTKNVQPAPEADAIQFTAPIAQLAQPATPSKTAHDVDGKTSWVSGDAIGIFCDKASNGATASEQNAKYTYTTTFGTTSPIYWVNKTVDHKFQAYYPWVDGSTAAAVKLPDISAQTGELAAVDVLISPETVAVKKSANPVALTDFTHALSLVEFKIVRGDGLATLNLEKLTLAATKISTGASATLNIADGVITGAAGNEVVITKVAAIDATGVTVQAVIVPATYGTAPTLAMVTNGDINAVEAISVGTTEFVANTKYTYTVTLKLGTVDISTPTISDWTPGTGGNIDPEI